MAATRTVGMTEAEVWEAVSAKITAGAGPMDAMRGVAEDRSIPQGTIQKMYYNHRKTLGLTKPRGTRASGADVREQRYAKVTALIADGKTTTEAITAVAELEGVPRGTVGSAYTRHNRLLADRATAAAPTASVHVDTQDTVDERGAVPDAPVRVPRQRFDKITALLSENPELTIGMAIRQVADEEGIGYHTVEQSYYSERRRAADVSVDPTPEQIAALDAIAEEVIPTNGDTPAPVVAPPMVPVGRKKVGGPTPFADDDRKRTPVSRNGSATATLRAVTTKPVVDGSLSETLLALAAIVEGYESRIDAFNRLVDDYGALIDRMVALREDLPPR